MKFPLADDTFPPLALTRDEERQLAAVAEAIVKRTVDEYVEHLTVNNSAVDERRWKKIKQRDDVHVFRDRGPDRESGELLAPLFAFGTIVGTLDDIMYGAISPNTEEMRLKSAYVEDGLVDWKLLAPIIAPSDDDPFHELSVKWLVKGIPLLLSPIGSKRDVLYIDASGLAETPNGERIGYHLKHSVEIPVIRELSDLSFVRAKSSICYLFRQRDPKTVEMYYRGIISPMGDAHAAIAAVVTSAVTVSVWKLGYCAGMKKLARVLASCAANSKALSESSVSTVNRGGSSVWSGDSLSSSYFIMRSRSTGSSSSSPTQACAQCTRSLSRLFKLRSSRERSCAICTLAVCSRCRVRKTVYLPSLSKDKTVAAVTKTVCTLCMARVLNSSSSAFAALDARAARGETVDYMEALAGV